MAILLRRDPDTGYTLVDFFVNQSARWVERVTIHETDEASPVVDVSDDDAVLRVRSTRASAPVD